MLGPASRAGWPPGGLPGYGAGPTAERAPVQRRVGLRWRAGTGGRDRAERPLYPASPQV